MCANCLTLNLPGISPTAWPLRPNPATKTSSFSSMKVKQPSLGTKAVIFLPFLMSWTRTHFRMAELGCLASTPLLTNDWINLSAHNRFYVTSELTLSQAQFPWREKLLRRGWPSTWFRGEPSCNRDRPNVGSDGSSRACERSWYLRVYPFWRIGENNSSKIKKKLMQKY